MDGRIMTQRLPSSLLDLIEHVELTRSGWWDIALANVLLAAIWLHGKPVRREQVWELVASAFNLEIPPDRITSCTERLVNQGKLKVTGSDQVVPATNIADQMDARLKAAQNNEHAVRDAFIEQIGDCCAPHTPEEAWALFMERYFLPIINLLGARTLHLIGGDGTEDADVAALTDAFLTQFDASHRTDMRSAVGRFLSPDDANVRQYVTEHLDAVFLVRASGLTSDAIAGISKFGQRRPTFRLFLDTNFLFSLLDLHENPSNESAQILGKMIQQIGQHLSIRMNITYPTMEEIKRTLQAFQTSLDGMRMLGSLADAALGVGLSGVAMRFARANREAGPISARDYFRPFLTDLTPILRSKGIEVYNERLEEYRQRRDVINDLHEMARLNGESENERQRKYNAALHDSILWHVANDRRPPVFESPLEAVYWVVTNDYGLLNFDRRRQKAMKSAAGVCIHPAELVQILRLWEPRSTDMEQALLSGLRLPFMFFDFDAGKENASMRVLKALSRFEHIGDLEPDVIRDIVLSDAVRTKTTAARTEEEENEIIRDALLHEHGEIIEQRDAAIRRAREAESNLAKERATTAGMVMANSERTEALEEHIAVLESDLVSAKSVSDKMNVQIDKLMNIIQSERDAHVIRSIRLRFIALRSAFVGVFTLIVAGLGLGFVGLGETNALTIALPLSGIWLLGVLLIATVGIKDSTITTWNPVRSLLALRRQAMLIIGALTIAVVGNAIWQMLQLSVGDYFSN